MLPILRNGPDLVTIHKFEYFQHVFHSFNNKNLIVGLNFSYFIFERVNIESKFSPSFCFPNAIPDDVTASTCTMCIPNRQNK